MLSKKIQILKTIEIKQDNSKKILNLKGPLGSLILNIPIFVNIVIDNNLIIIITDKRKKIPFLNLYLSLIKQKMKGIFQGFKRKLYIKGLGYKFFIEDNKLILKLGYSHLIEIDIPKEINIKVYKASYLVLFSIDLLKLTQFITLIKKKKKNDVFKGKGIYLKEDKIKKKIGKKK